MTRRASAATIATLILGMLLSPSSPLLAAQAADKDPTAASQRQGTFEIIYGQTIDLGGLEAGASLSLIS